MAIYRLSKACDFSIAFLQHASDGFSFTPRPIHDPAFFVVSSKNTNSSYKSGNDNVSET